MYNKLKNVTTLILKNFFKFVIVAYPTIGYCIFMKEQTALELQHGQNQSTNCRQLNFPRKFGDPPYKSLPPNTGQHNYC